MKVQECSVNSNTNKKNNSSKQLNSTNFKGVSCIDLAGNFMQMIENNGFWASFIVQDCLGMTAPRVYTGFKRDKEVTGHYNIQEGTEVLLREGLTGPIMMAIAPLMFLFTAKFGKTTTINSQFIKRFGNNLKEMFETTRIDTDLLKNDKEKFKKNYIEINIKKILNNTLGENNYTDNDFKYINEELEKYSSTSKQISKKEKKQALNNIVERINNLRYSCSSDLNMLNNVKINSENGKVYTTQQAFEALSKYTQDAIVNNKNLANLDAAKTEELTDRLIAKRVISNVTTAATTVGVLSFIPKIYAKSNISPGARTAMELKKANANKENEQPENKIKQEVTFKAKSTNKSLLGKIGKFFSNIINDKTATEFEYDGNNFTGTLMAILSVFGLLMPRGIKAVKRAQVDETGKKDMSELHEILIRDLCSSLSVIFAVPMLTRAFVTSYEKRTGFVLLKTDRTNTGFKTFIDLINPWSKSKVLTNSEINSLYGNIDSHKKLMNFCEYIDKNNGDLQKILQKSPEAKEWFNSSTFELDSIKNLSKKDKNAKITEFFRNMASNSNITKNGPIEEQIKKVMSYANNKGKMISHARGLTSGPAAIMTLAISPILLGMLIPKLTYLKSRQYHAKREAEIQKIKAEKNDITE